MATTAPPTEPDVVYPDSDGKPMADNTLQYEWIVTLKGNLDALFAGNPGVFVAGDNLIYPVKGNNTIRQAPDVYVAFGRPKGHRGSYRVWVEGGLFPQVVFEVRSPGNRAGEMARKLAFYDQYGAEEYYLYDPDRNTLEGYTRTEEGLDTVPEMNGFASPLLGIRFDTSSEPLVVYYPDGRRFLTFQEVMDQAASAELRATEARVQVEQARRQADQARVQADQARIQADLKQRENERLRAILQAAGIDPDAGSVG